ncbi:hypothetical protein BYT27DRAFT_7251840 [Phlegmacium glaucopus]|nr:hypothetical protein BYT27DRAFT_7251840 [Phlegmacium glaucopus]
MQRPGPLQELPLERFLSAHPNLLSKSVRSHKRQLSPGSPNPYSPTKRRILNSEGVFAPEKTCKTPMSLGKASPTRFGDVLASSASPARILNFGLPKNRRGEPTKRSFMPIPTQTQIPSLSPRKTLTTSRPVSSSAYHSSSELPAGTEESSTSSTRPAVPIDIPRNLPPLPDPQSIHYPGFVVFQDTHITIYPAGSDFNPETLSDIETNADSSKENLPPRRKTLCKTTLKTPKVEATPMGKSKSFTETPTRGIGNLGPSSTHVGPDLSSSCSPMKVDARKRLRRMMEEDDIEEGQNDDDE